MGVREYKWLCYFISRINWVNKTASKQEITITIFYSVNHTRFPEEDHLPDCASRDNKVKKGDRVEWRRLAVICGGSKSVGKVAALLLRLREIVGVCRVNYCCNTLYRASFIILYNDQQMHNYFTNYHTATCFDTIVSSSDSLQSIPCQVTQLFQMQLSVIQFTIKIFHMGFMQVLIL